MPRTKELPRHDQLHSYNHAVAGHAGTLCDADGELFIKPCTAAEIDFYQSANRRHPDFADLMPLFMGTLALSDPSSVHIAEDITGFVNDHGHVETRREHIEHTVTELVQAVSRENQAKAEEQGKWVPNKSRKIQTDTAIVLESASHGFKQANIMDCKLGTRLWADDAPQEKKDRFDRIAAETTHKNLGFRIAGMRVYRGSESPSELDDEDFKIYDKDYGRFTINDDNVLDGFRNYVFNSAAGIDKETGKAICQAFVNDLRHVQDVLEREESRMYSASLLFVMEGDGDALRAAIEENNAVVERINKTHGSCRTTKRVDSGIALEDGDCEDSDDEEDLSGLPKMYSLKLIDFAHAQWTPGLGPDENILKGVRSLIRIFEQLAQ